MMGELERTDLELLSHLLKARGRAVEIVFFLHKHHTSPRQIDRSVDNLVRHGCRIERDMREVRMVESGLGVWSDYLKHALPAKPARAVEVYQSTTSTQDLAKSRAKTPLVVLADQQTGGRGRLGRRWHAPAGTGVLLSMTHTPAASESGSIDRASFLTAVAVAQAIERLTGRGLIQIKWPNDLTVGRRKLAGILVEAVNHGLKSPTTLVIGVGINVDLTREHLADMPAELRPIVTSFAMQGWQADRLLVAEHVITQIERNLQDPDVPLLVDEWRVRNLFRDQSIRLACEGRSVTGTVIDLDPDAGLIVRRDSGEIVHLPAATTTVLT